MLRIPIGNTEEKTRRKSPLKIQVEASQVLDYAAEALIEVFGRERAFHAKPLFLKNRTLTVTCSSSAMAQEIRGRQTEILDKINEKMGKKEVDCIRYLA